jgi:hypothetical protein
MRSSNRKAGVSFVEVESRSPERLDRTLKSLAAQQRNSAGCRHLQRSSVEELLVTQSRRMEVERKMMLMQEEKEEGENEKEKEGKKADSSRKLLVKCFAWVRLEKERHLDPTRPTLRI